jgi:hypothetical protein
MVRARAANRTTASIRFGAAHRVYFDNPPLKGSCRCTVVHLLKIHGHTGFRCTWVHFSFAG